MARRPTIPTTFGSTVWNATGLVASVETGEEQAWELAKRKESMYDVRLFNDSKIFEKEEGTGHYGAFNSQSKRDILKSTRKNKFVSWSLKFSKC